MHHIIDTPLTILCPRPEGHLDDGGWRNGGGEKKDRGTVAKREEGTGDKEKEGGGGFMKMFRKHKATK